MNLTRTAVRAGVAALAGVAAVVAALIVLPVCSDMGGAGPVYCVGGMGSFGTLKLAVVFLVAAKGATVALRD